MMRTMHEFLCSNKYTFVTLLLGAFYFALVVFVHDVNVGDYTAFAHYPFDPLYGIHRWFDWSSRVFIEGAANLFSKSVLLWQLTTIAFGALLFWSLGRLLKNRRLSQAIVLIVLFLLTNFDMLTSAGVFATTINYLWPMACFAYVATVVLKPFGNRKLNIFARILVVPLFAFAVCSEQLAALGLFLSAAYVLYLMHDKRKVPKLVWVIFGLSILGIFSVALSPGNAIRASLEAGNWWPGFENVSTPFKVLNGVIVTFSRLFLAPELLAVVLVFALLSAAMIKRNIRAFTATLPAVVLMVLFFFPSNAGEPTTYIRTVNFFNVIRESAINLNYNTLLSVSMTKLFLIIIPVVLFSIIASVYYLYGRSIKTYTLLVLLVSGLAVSLAVSFSPTIFASNTRTLYPLIIILIIINATIIQDVLDRWFYPESNDETRPKIKKVRQ